MGICSIFFNSLKKGVRSLFKVKSITKTGTKMTGINDMDYTNISKVVFRDSTTPKSGFIAYLQDLKNTLNNNSIYMPKDVKKAYSILSDKANIFADRISTSISKGKTPQNKSYQHSVIFQKKSEHYYFEKFQKKYSDEFTTIEKYLKEQEQIFSEQVCAGKCKFDTWKDFNNLKENLRYLSSYNSKYHIKDLYDPRITELGRNIIDSKQYFYHGTHAQKSILKEGFSLKPKAVQAETASREIGKAVYLTPDREVASFFAGMKGNIIKTKVNIDKIAVMNIEQINLIKRELSKKIPGGCNMTPALQEEAIAELFKRNGFDAVYTKGCLNDDLAKIFGNDVDKLIGHPQTQLAVFEPNRINVCKKSMKERFSNQVLQIKTKSHLINYIFKELH